MIADFAVTRYLAWALFGSAPRPIIPATRFHMHMTGDTDRDGVVNAHVSLVGDPVRYMFCVS